MFRKPNGTIQWIEIYLVENVIHHLKNCGLTIHSYNGNWHPILLCHNLFYFVLNYVTDVQYENIGHPKFILGLLIHTSQTHYNHKENT